MRQLRYQAMEERLNVAHRPMLQFTPEELGEDVESLGSPPCDNIDQPSIRKIEVQHGETGPFEETGLGSPPSSSAKVGESLTESGDQGQELGGCSSSYSEVEAGYSMEHDLMQAQDQCQQWKANCSMAYDSVLTQDTNQQRETDHSLEHVSMLAQDINQQWEADFSMEHDSMLAQDRNQLSYTERWNEPASKTYSQGEEERQILSQSCEGKHIEFSTTSLEVEPNSIGHERMVQFENLTCPVACTSMLQDLGAIRLPAWKSRPQSKSEPPVENTTEGNNDHYEVRPSVDAFQAYEPTTKQEAPPPPPQETGNDSFEWNRYYNNPSFCGGQQYDDNFLLSLQGMNQVEKNCNKGRLNNNPSFCGQQIDDNFLVGMHRLNNIEPNCNKGILCATFSDANEHECDPETVC
ncbi:unnamed protein product [Calypogeia fissa]